MDSTSPSSPVRRGSPQNQQAIDEMAQKARIFDAQLVSQLAHQIASQLPGRQIGREKLMTAFMFMSELSEKLIGERMAITGMPKAAKAELDTVCAELQTATAAMLPALIALDIYDYWRSSGEMPTKPAMYLRREGAA